MPDFNRDWNPANMTVMDEVWAEFNLVKRTVFYVLYQWTQLPGRL
jgi:ERO1-like protein beta